MKLFLATLLLSTFALSATVTNTTKLGTRGKTVTTGAAAGATTDVSESIDISNMHRGAIQAAGTFGTTTFTVQVSNDGSTWVTAKDPLGNDVTFTAAGLRYLQMGAKYLRVSAPSGNGTALIATVSLSN